MPRTRKANKLPGTVRFLLTLCLLLACTLTAAAQSRPADDPLYELHRLVFSDNKATPRTLRRYDRFENRTLYWTAPITVRKGLSVAAHFSFKGRGAGHEIEGFYLSFQSTASDWQFLKQSRLLCLIDGKPHDLGVPVARDDEVKTNYQSLETRELLIYGADIGTVAAIASAQSVEMRIGDVELALDQGFRDAVKELIGKVQIVKRTRGTKQRNRD